MSEPTPPVADEEQQPEPRRVLELLIAYTDHTWTTRFVDLDASVFDEEHLLEHATDVYMSTLTAKIKESIALIAIYADFGG